jgi:hypothetical protein
MRDEDTTTTAWKIYEALLAAGCGIGNASVPIIRKVLREFRDELLERAARVAESPITGNGHSLETRAKSEHAVSIARAIRDMKGPKVLRTRRLK